MTPIELLEYGFAVAGGLLACGLVLLLLASLLAYLIGDRKAR